MDEGAGGRHAPGVGHPGPPTEDQGSAQTPVLTIRYGLGISSFSGFLGHDGAIFGYGSTAVYLPAGDATIVAICNAGGIVANPTPLFIVLALAAYLFPSISPAASSLCRAWLWPVSIGDRGLR